MKYIRGFLMAWGNFSAVPCPYHKWHENSRKAMLCMLPVVGIMLAAITIIAWWVLDMIGAPPVLTGALITVVYFCCSGFIHLDGFMDCSDAILSRRPELEERQRILKASDVGAFAVISVVMMFLVFAASMITLAEDFSIEKAAVLIVTMAISRGIAADYVGRKPAMKTSQYANLGAEIGEGSSPDDMKKLKAREQGILNLMIVIPILVLPMIVKHGEDPVAFWILFAGAAFITLIASALAGKYAIKQLGGMSGDIAGYMIVMSETAGVLTAAVLSALLI